jgi:hypothetical protein
MALRYCVKKRPFHGISALFLVASKSWTLRDVTVTKKPSLKGMWDQSSYSALSRLKSWVFHRCLEDLPWTADSDESRDRDETA